MLKSHLFANCCMYIIMSNIGGVLLRLAFRKSANSSPPFGAYCGFKYANTASRFREQTGHGSEFMARTTPLRCALGGRPAALLVLSQFIISVQRRDARRPDTTLDARPVGAGVATINSAFKFTRLIFFTVQLIEKHAMSVVSKIEHCYYTII